MNLKTECLPFYARVYPGPFLQGRTRYDFKQHPGSSLFVTEAPWLLWHLANISQADQIPRLGSLAAMPTTRKRIGFFYLNQQPSGIRIYTNLKQTNKKQCPAPKYHWNVYHMYTHVYTLYMDTSLHITATITESHIKHEWMTTWCLSRFRTSPP